MKRLSKNEEVGASRVVIFGALDLLAAWSFAQRGARYVRDLDRQDPPPERVRPPAPARGLRVPDKKTDFRYFSDFIGSVDLQTLPSRRL